MKKSLKMTIMGIAAVLLCWIPNQAQAANAECFVTLDITGHSYPLSTTNYYASGAYNEAVGWVDVGTPRADGIQNITMACEVGGKGFPNLIMIRKHDGANDADFEMFPGMMFFRVYPAGAHDHITGVGAGSLAHAPDGIYPHCNSINSIAGKEDAPSCGTGKVHLMYWYGNDDNLPADVKDHTYGSVGGQAWVDVNANGEYQDLGANYWATQGGNGWHSGPWYVNELNIDGSWPEISRARIWAPAHALPSSGTDLTPVTDVLSAIETKLDNLPAGPAGPQGDAGAQGAQGKIGPAGADGTAGSNAPCVECSDIADAAFALACKLLTLHQPTTLEEFRESVTTISNVSIVGSGNNICAPNDADGACATDIDSQVQGIFDGKGL